MGILVAAKRVSHIGRSITIRGDVSSDEDLVLDGQVEGRVEVPDHHLTIGPDAEHIQGELMARELTINGSVSGSVLAIEHLEISATGRLEGDVTTPRLSIKEGAVLNGTVTMKGPQDRAIPVAETGGTPHPGGGNVFSDPTGRGRRSPG